MEPPAWSAPGSGLTKAYDAVKEGIEEGTLAVGESQDTIKKEYGEPVVVIPANGKFEKWIYKPGYVSHFDGVKIYLYFDNDRKLANIRSFSGKE